MEIFLLFILIFVFGTTVGSFLNVIVDRNDSKESIITGRSRCDYCKELLQAYDLIPLASYIFLGGRCRYCKKKLNLYYPTIELLTGLSFVVVFVVVGEGSLGSIVEFVGIIYYLLIISVLIVIFFADLKYGIIPFKAVLVGVLATLGWYLAYPSTNITYTNYLISAVSSFAAFLLIFLATRGKGIGFGDVVYVFFMGLLLGFPKIILGFYVAFLSGAIISLVLIALKLKKLRGDSIPFGPFLVTGTIVSLFWGNLLIDRITAYLLP
jgi:leader peptidase (prepilin peptidase) / N-methyltransferase